MDTSQAAYPASDPGTIREGDSTPPALEVGADVASAEAASGALDASRGRGLEARPVLLFDGVCNLCNRTVDFVMQRDGGRHLFGSLQSPEGQRLLARADLDESYLDSIVLVDGDRVLAAADAVLEIGRHMTGTWRVLAAIGRLVPRGLRNAVYHFVAGRRYRWFGKRDQCRLPTPEEAARFIERGGTAPSG